MTSRQAKLGTILVAGPKQLTVYMFAGDTGSSSTCSGSCAAVWPPVTSAASAAAGGRVLAGKLGTTMRSDGSRQVTYDGHPLYYYAPDRESGEANGRPSSPTRRGPCMC